MHDLAFNNPIAANGDYDVTGLESGYRYKFSIKGNWGGGTIQLKANNGVAGAFEEVDDGVFGATREEETVEPLTDTLRFTLSGATTPALQLTFERMVE